MKKYLINGNILIKRHNQYIIEQHNILVNNHIIIGFDTICENVETIDMKGKLIVCSFFNAHCHLGESIFKYIEGKDWTLNKYLNYTNEHNKKISKKKQKIEWTNSAKYTIEENIKNGITGFCAARSAQISKEYSIDNMSGYPLMKNEKLIEYTEAGINGFIEYKDKYKSEKCNVGLFFHSLYVNDAEILHIAKQCMEYGAEFISVHISEDIDSRKKEIEKHGKEAIYVLDEIGLISEKTLLVHCGYTSKEELKIIANKGATIAICPISNNFLNTKIPDIYYLEQLGIKWCLATDGLGTGRTFSLIEQAKCLKEHFSKISNIKILQAITEIPAILFNRKHYSGLIEIGKVSNFIVIDENRTNVEQVLEDLFNNTLSYKIMSV